MKFYPRAWANYVAGVQFRQECAALMQKQGFPEPTGQAKITKAYNLSGNYKVLLYLYSLNK